MQPTLLTSPQRIHHHQGDAPTVLALVPLLPSLLPTPTRSFRPSPMPLTPTARSVMGPRATAPVQFLRCGRGSRLAVDLNDQDLPLLLGQGTFAQVDISGPGQSQDPLLDRRTRQHAPRNIPPSSLATRKLIRVAKRQNQPITRGLKASRSGPGPRPGDAPRAHRPAAARGTPGHR